MMLHKVSSSVAPKLRLITYICKLLIYNLRWLQYKQLSFLSLDVKEEYGGSDPQAPPAYLPKFSSQASIYYGCNNLFFLISAVIFLVQGKL